MKTEERIDKIASISVPIVNTQFLTHLYKCFLIICFKFRKVNCEPFYISQVTQRLFAPFKKKQKQKKP